MCNLGEGIAEENYAKGFAEGVAEVMEDGFAEGIAIGEERLSKLINLLLKNNEIEKITVVTSDPVEREKLYGEYGIA